MIIDGKTIAAEITEELKRQVAKAQGREPGLACVLVGDDPASNAYVNIKALKSEQIGIKSVVLRLPINASQAELLSEIDKLNNDDSIDGILVQMPLPPHISATEVIRRIDPDKDVDGFHPVNMGKLLIGDTDGLFPCTPLGIRELLVRHQVELTGKHVVVVGRSNIVGKPIAALLAQTGPYRDATVTLLHKESRDYQTICASADVLIVAIGQPEFIKADMVKPGAVVIDVGITHVPADNKRGFRLVGDVAFSEVSEKASLITPVPGGVGPMTVAMLLQNTWTSYVRRR